MLCRSSVSGQLSLDGRAGSLWSGELTRNTAGFGFSENQVTIALDAAGNNAGSSRADVSQPVKEVPLWLSHSTVDPTDRLHTLQVSEPLATFTHTQVRPAVLVFQYLASHTPSYLADDCQLVSEARPRQLLSTDSLTCDVRHLKTTRQCVYVVR